MIPTELKQKQKQRFVVLNLKSMVIAGWVQPDLQTRILYDAKRYGIIFVARRKTTLFSYQFIAGRLGDDHLSLGTLTLHYTMRFESEISPRPNPVPLLPIDPPPPPLLSFYSPLPHLTRAMIWVSGVVQLIKDYVSR